MIKKYSIVFLILYCFIPTVVSANIICNDGTISPTCSVCSRGCCSSHGGCTDNPNNYADSYDDLDDSSDSYEEDNGSDVYENDDEYYANESSEDNESETMVDYAVKGIYLEISIMVTVISGIICVIKLFNKGGM